MFLYQTNLATLPGVFFFGLYKHNFILSTKKYLSSLDGSEAAFRNIGKHYPTSHASYFLTYLKAGITTLRILLMLVRHARKPWYQSRSRMATKVQLRVYLYIRDYKSNWHRRKPIQTCSMSLK